MPESLPVLKVAAVQAAPVYLDREATVDKACRLIAEAGDHGARVVGFPETFVAGYPHYYLTLSTNPFREHGKWFKRLHRNALEIPSPAAERLCQAARKARAHVVIGISEKDRLGALYNSQLFIGDRGEILGVHRKLIPTLFEKLLYASGDGSRLQVVDTAWGELGALICGEHTSSLAKFSLIARGERIHVAAWPAFPRKLHPRHQNETVLFRVRQHAHEAKAFVISASGHFSAEMVDDLCRTDEEKSRLRPGGGCSAIVGVRGEILAGPLLDEEGIVYAEIDLEDRIEASLTQDVLGHSSRFDVLSLKWDGTRREPMARTDGALPAPEPLAGVHRKRIRSTEKRARSRK